MKYRLFAFVLVLCLTLLSSRIPFDPVFRYEGDRADLAATAIYSIPGTESSPYDVMLALETDQYGRTLYACYLSSSFAGSFLNHSYDNMNGQCGRIYFDLEEGRFTW